MLSHQADRFRIREWDDIFHEIYSSLFISHTTRALYSACRLVKEKKYSLGLASLTSGDCFKSLNLSLTLWASICVCVEFPASSGQASQLPIVWAESHFLTGQNSRKQGHSPNKLFGLHLHPGFITPVIPRSHVPRKGMFPTGS